MKKLNGYSAAVDRNAAIVEMAQSEPGLTLQSIGEHFGGLSASAVSLIISGKRGTRGGARLQKINQASTDGELQAISMMMEILAPLGGSARRRVVEYAIERLSEKEVAPAKISILTEGLAE